MKTALEQKIIPFLEKFKDEPEIGRLAATFSIAISLKRIADEMDAAKAEMDSVVRNQQPARPIRPRSANPKDHPPWLTFVEL